MPDATAQPLRFAACATHPIQYQAPLWRRLAAMPGVQFEAFFGTDMSVRGYTDREFGTKVAWDIPLCAGYAHMFLSTDPRIQSISALTPNAAGLRAHFRRLRPQVVLLTAYSSRFHLGALRAARAVGAKVIMRHEASDVAVARSRGKAAVRDFLLRRLYSRVDRFAVIGTEARRHLGRLGVPESRMTPAPYCVDSDFFAEEVARWQPRRAELRREFGFPDDAFVLVFCGKLIAKKDPLLVPRAVAALPEAIRPRVHWLIAGTGELRAELESAARGVFGERAHFLGFLNQSEIGRAYAAGDALVLPSLRGAGETWGLVVNEAMQFGLPALVSDGVGCGVDLVSDTTGAIFPSGDGAALAAAIEHRVRRPVSERASARAAAEETVRRFSAEAAAAGLLAAARRTF